MTNILVEDFRLWNSKDLVALLPETLERVELIGLVVELQNRLEEYVEHLDYEA